MTATDLDRWAADQAAYGSPDYVRGYRDGIDDAVQAAKDLGEVGPSAFWTDHGHGAVRAELAGKDLACWCPLDQPCHADMLLEIANGDPS